MGEMKRGEFLKLAAAGATTLAVGCRTAEGGTGMFSFTVLNPDCMVGGAGQCVVLRMPSGKTYLYDTGNGDFRRQKTKNNGKDIVVPWLRAHGIRKIDGLIISHYHADHFGGFLTMWDAFPIDRVFNNNYTPDFTGLREHDITEYKVARKAIDDWAAKHPGRLVENTKEGDDLGWNEADVTVDVVWPPKEGPVKPIAKRDAYGKNDNHFHHLLNGNSTALRITAGGKVFFIVGDIQADYLREYMKPRMEKLGTWGCDVAVLPSHGTMPQEVVKDFETMKPQPKTVIASLGNIKWMIDCGRSCMRVWPGAGYETYVTNIHGDILVTPDGKVRLDGTKLYNHNPV